MSAPTRHRAVLALAGLLVVGATVVAAQEEAVELPFEMPVPEGWRTETIPFPLEFAPDLPYRGLEELRFAPGMFQEGSEDFWSYAFVWWIDRRDPSDLESIETHLVAYFRGLMQAVAESREFEIGDARFEATLEQTPVGFTGTAETYDSFVTRAQLVLNLEGTVRDCPSRERRAVLFGFSPQGMAHPIWETLGEIREGFRCSAAPER